MAARRLNKKVALIGAAVSVSLALAVVVVVLSGTHDPAKLIEDGDTALAAEDYESARRNYLDAFGSTESLDQKVGLLFKLSDVYRATGDWRRVVGCWEQVITSDPKNLPARFARLKHAYILADGLSEFGQSVDTHWKEVAARATELIDLAEDAGLLGEEKATWEPSFGMAEQPGWDNGIRLTGPYLHFLKGRAAFELARMGAAAAPQQSLEEARAHLTKSKQLDSHNAAVYRYLAAAFLEGGNIAASRGNLNERQAAIEAADAVLAEGVAAAPDVPSAHVNLLVRKLTLAQDGTIVEAREKMKALEPEYQALTERFPDSAESLGALAEFYSFYSTCVGLDDGRAKLDRAIEAAEKAAARDVAVKYARFAATLHYRKFSLYGDEAALSRAIALTEGALARPQAQDTPGPRQYAVLAERLSLCSLVATACVEQMLTLPASAPERPERLTRAGSAVHEIEQIQGTADNPEVVKWRGMLELARGNRAGAVRSLYAAYEQIKAADPSGQTDAFLAYMLGQAFEETSEVGAVLEFYESALRSGITTTKPETLLDYGSALLRAGSYDTALNVVNSFEERFGAVVRSRRLRLRALIANGHLTQAEEALAVLEPADPNTMRLRLSLLGAKAMQLQEAIQRAESRTQSDEDADGTNTAGSVNAMKAELLGCRKRQAEIAGKLWQRGEADISQENHLAQLCETLIEYQEAAVARDIVTVFLRSLPHSATALFYQGLLAEPDPCDCQPARRQEIRREAIGRIADPVARAMALGAFYQENDRLDDAAAQWRKVLNETGESETGDEAIFSEKGPLSPRQLAAGRLFDLACYREDWPPAEEIVKAAKKGNLDGCQGHLYAGRLAFARGWHQDALAELDECLRLRPVFSYGYMVRGNIHAAAGNERASIDDTRRAAGLNPVDPVVAKALANALLVRNRKLGGSASTEHLNEARRALEHAIRLNPRDTQVLIAYADLIGDSEPLKALAIRQTIQANAPSLGNAVTLGRLATNAALKETDDARRKALFAIAEDAFEQARRTDPSNAVLLESFAEYYRARGRSDKAQQLLVESQDSRLLWRHYLRIGRYDEAKQLLEQMRAEPASRADALKGLVLVAEATGDKEAVKRHAESLLAIEDTVTNRLAQIRAYLDAGLIRDARHKVQSFKERYPDEPRIGLLEALLAQRQGKLKRALELANRHLEKNQRDASAWRLRGEISLLSGAVDQAIADFRQSRSLEDHPATAVELAKAYLWAGRDSDAVRALSAALDAPAAPPQARTLLESTCRRLGRDDKLWQLYQDTLSRLPQSIAWLTRAGAFALEQRDYGRAVELYEKAYRLRREQLSDAIDATRDVPFAMALDGYLHALILSAGTPGGAWNPQALERVLQEGGRYLDSPYAGFVLCRLAEAEKAQGDTAAAGKHGRQAIDRAWNDDGLAAQVLPRVAALLGEETVSDYCRQRLETAPDSLAANVMMSHLARTRGDYDDAVGYIDKCVALCDPQGQQHGEYVLKKADILTAAYRRTSDKRYLRQAIDVYESLAAQMPTNSSVLNNLAYLLAQDDSDSARALGYAEKALAADPDNAVYLDTYAYVLHKNGRNAEAAEWIAAAIQQYELDGAPSAAAYEHFGLIEEALGRKENALAAYRRALQVAGEAADERIRLAVERLQ